MRDQVKNLRIRESTKTKLDKVASSLGLEFRVDAMDLVADYALTEHGRASILKWKAEELLKCAGFKSVTVG